MLENLISTDIVAFLKDILNTTHFEILCSWQNPTIVQGKRINKGHRMY